MDPTKSEQLMAKGRPSKDELVEASMNIRDTLAELYAGEYWSVTLSTLETALRAVSTLLQEAD